MYRVSPRNTYILSSLFRTFVRHYSYAFIRFHSRQVRRITTGLSLQPGDSRRCLFIQRCTRPSDDRIIYLARTVTGDSPSYPRSFPSVRFEIIVYRVKIIAGLGSIYNIGSFSRISAATALVKNMSSREKQCAKIPPRSVWASRGVDVVTSP